MLNYAAAAASSQIIMLLSLTALKSLVFEWFREAPTKKYLSSFGHCPFGGGGLNPCQDGLGHLFIGELSKYKQAFA